MGVTGYEKALYQNVDRIAQELKRIADLLEVHYLKELVRSSSPGAVRDSHRLDLTRLENKLWRQRQ